MADNKPTQETAAIEVPAALLKLERLRLAHLRDFAIIGAYNERRRELMAAIKELNRRDAQLAEDVFHKASGAAHLQALHQGNAKAKAVLEAQLELVEQAKTRAATQSLDRGLFHAARETLRGTLSSWGLEEWES